MVHVKLLVPPRRIWEVAVSVAALSLLALLLNPVISHSQGPDAQQACLANQHRLAQALLLNAQAQGTLPTTATVWRALRLPATTLCCPAAPTLANGYVYSRFVAGKTLAALPAPETELLTADGDHRVTATEPDANIAYGEADFARRHAGLLVASFVDGHVTARPQSAWRFHAARHYRAADMLSYYNEGQSIDTLPDVSGQGYPATLAQSYAAAPTLAKSGPHGQPAVAFDKSILVFTAPAHVYAAVFAGVRAEGDAWPNLLCLFASPGKLYGYIARFDDRGCPQSIIGVQEGAEMYAITGTPVQNGQPFVYAFSLNNATNTLTDTSGVPLKNGTAFTYLNGVEDAQHGEMHGEPVAATGYDGRHSAIFGAGGTVDMQWGYFAGSLGEVILFDHPVDKVLLGEAQQAALRQYARLAP